MAPAEAYANKTKRKSENIIFSVSEVMIPSKTCKEMVGEESHGWIPRGSYNSAW